MDYSQKFPGTEWAACVAGRHEVCRITHTDSSTYVFVMCVAEVLTGPHAGTKIARPVGDFFCISLMARPLIVAA